jgi:hypothetical protein
MQVSDMEEDYSNYEKEMMITRNLRIKDARDAAEQRVKEFRSQQPQYILWDLVKKMKIKTIPTLTKYELDPNYSRRDSIEDFDKIMRSIKNMKDDGILPQKTGEPLAIIAIQPTLLNPPRWYYVRNDISEGRKKKTVKPKSKRKPVKKCKCK